MSSQGTIHRYILLIEKISSQSCPSFSTLSTFLHSHGFEIASRTLQRDIEAIRVEFGIEIKYDHSKRGYFIDEDSSINIASFLKFLEIVGTANLLTETLKEGKDALKYVSFESEGNLKGIENLKSILFAVKSKRKVTFQHYSYSSGETRLYQINPYLLKEYLNRWYIFGYVEDLEAFRTFGIDRIFDLKVKTEKFIPIKGYDPQQRFKNIIGLNYSEGESVEVILSFSPLQGEYVKALKLHHSQTIILENDNEVQIRLHITPNFEFTQRLLMLGADVKVLSPKGLVKEIKDSLRATLKQYS